MRIKLNLPCKNIQFWPIKILALIYLIKKIKRFYNKWLSDVESGRNQINRSNFFYFYGGNDANF